ncbi:unnamed protein product [Larinioides sclopetarius]|uniref:Uncharacterized protein n=1 Tax=Larinioides sclopetarius TaxID=280406 RepID=A0AAV1ZZ75_9ARAC
MHAMLLRAELFSCAANDGSFLILWISPFAFFFNKAQFARAHRSELIFDESKVILAELKRLERPNVEIDRGRQQSGMKRSVKSGDFVRPLIESLLSAHWVWSSRSLARSHSNPTAPFDILFLSPRTRAVNERTPHWTCTLLRRPVGYGASRLNENSEQG